MSIDGETAVLVPERDAGALAHALRTLLDDPDRCERMGRAGRRFVEEHHDVEREVDILEERYDRLLARSVAPS